MAATPKICPRSFNLVEMESAVTGKKGRTIINTQCVGAACALWIPVNGEDPNGPGMCADAVNALALSRIAEDIAAFTSDEEEDAAPPVGEKGN